MTVDIPPSPKAEEVPEYAQRLREIQELSRKKPVHRRWKDRARQNELLQAKEREGEKAVRAAASQGSRWIRNCERPQETGDETSKTIRPKKDLAGHAEKKPKKLGKVREAQREKRAKRGEERASQGPTDAPPRSEGAALGGGRIVALSVVASSAASLFVSLASQSFARDGLAAPGSLLGLVLAMIGMGS